MPSLTSPAPAGTARSVTARRLTAVCAALLAALLCALTVGANTASAHATLTSTDPRDGSVVQTAPTQITLNFSEGVLLSDDSVRVLDPKGKRVDSGTPGHVGGKTSTAAVRLHSGLPDGTFTVAWKVVSEDSHPINGAVTFSIGAPSKTSVKVSQGGESDGTVGTLYGIGRYVAYGGFAALVGASVFAGVCRSSRSVRKIAVGGWVTLFAATLVLLLLRGPYTDGEGIGAVLDLGGLGDVLSTKPGAAMLSRLLLLGAAAVFLAVLFGTYTRRTEEAEAAEAAGDDEEYAEIDHGRRQDLAFGLGFGGTVVAIGLAATWAMAEHASVGIQKELAMPVDVLHLLAVGVWLGGLVSLAVALRAGEPVGRTAVRRFSRLAFASVVVLVLTGLYQSWRQVGSWKALTGTEYGKWLLVKVGLMAVLVGLAAVSRRWTGRLLDAAEDGAGESAPAEGPKAGTKTKAKAKTKVAVAASAAPAGRTVSARSGGKGEDAAEDDAGSDGGSGTAADPVRSAQLARQRAAVDRTAALRERDADPVRGGLRRSVLAETVVAVVLLAVATVLSGTQPGRAETAQPAAAAAPDPLGVEPVSVEIPYDTGNKSGRGKAVVMLDPALPGDNSLHVFLLDRADRPVDAEEVKLSLTLKEKAIGPLRVPLRHLSTGHWSTESVRLPLGGAWQISLTVRTSDIDQVTETKTVKIAQ
ncbi:copper resistance protein CopC [Streptomyces sp. HD1123-B1]|uniref:copper resistance CopC/CopD family protein n=1 Tax=Streptomyces huangiella TaxID=3228804 RepID=UPI003D7E4E96